MDIFLGLTVFLGGILIGFLIRTVMIMEFNDGVATGYRRCQEERRFYENGWMAHESSSYVSRIPQPSDMPQITSCEGDTAARDKEDWEDAQ